jgi:hypothetical protein
MVHGDDQSHRVIESLAAQQNGYLLMLLEKEQTNERQRARLLASVSDVGDQRRLEKIFGVERAKSAATLRRVTRAHEHELVRKMVEMGVMSEDDADDDLDDDKRRRPMVGGRR